MKKKVKKIEKPFIKSSFTKDYFICNNRRCKNMWEPCGDEIDCPHCGSYNIYILKKDLNSKNKK